MKKFTLLLILLLVFINAGAREYFEKGDAIYREKHDFMGMSFGHCGIYSYWITEKDPALREAHKDIESTTEIGEGGVQENLFYHFYWHTTFWSVRTMSGLDWIMRNKIVKTAKDFRFRPTKYDWKDGYKNPLGDTATFRCDGLVEYCYEIALGDDWEPGNNGGIIQNDTWITLLPWRQMEALELRESAELHYINTELPVEGYTIKGSFILSVLASDGLFGSGTEKVEFYIDDNLVGTDAHEHSTADWYNYEWDSRTVTNGEHTLLAKGYDQAGNDKESQVNFFVDNSVPRVVSTSPADGASDIDVFAHITIGFNKEMDQTTVNSGTVLFNPSLHGGFSTEWSGGKTVTLTLTNLQEDLGFYTNYTVTVTDGVKDKDGTRLDGDRDGEPGGNYPFSFTTRLPEVTLEPKAYSALLSEGSGGNFSISIKNGEQRSVSIDLDDDVENSGGWTSSPIGNSYTLGANATIPLSYYVYNNGAEGNLYHRFNLTNNGVSLDNAEHCYSPYEEKEEDHPDEGPIVNPHYPTPWYLDTESNIGILLNGYSDGVGHLLGKYRINTCAVKKENLKVLGELHRSLSDLSVLVIPTGGLMGLENVASFKEGLKDFIEQGGNVVCLTQQYGYDWEILPNSPSGYGWREDQSCWQGAGYFSDWDVILSGQNNIVHSRNNEIV